MQQSQTQANAHRIHVTTKRQPATEGKRRNTTQHHVVAFRLTILQTAIHSLLSLLKWHTNLDPRLEHLATRRLVPSEGTDQVGVVPQTLMESTRAQSMQLREVPSAARNKGKAQTRLKKYAQSATGHKLKRTNNLKGCASHDSMSQRDCPG